MRSSIAAFVVILSRTTQTALCKSLTCGVDGLGTRVDRDRAAARGEPADTARLRAILRRLPASDRREERGEIRIAAQPRVPRDRGDRIAREVHDVGALAADVQDVERGSSRAAEDA